MDVVSFLVLFNLALFKLQFYPENSLSAQPCHQVMINKYFSSSRDWFIQREYWSCAHGVLQEF